MSCVPIIFARRSATLNYLLARTVNHDLFSPVLELGELCLQAPQSSLLLPNDGLLALIFLDLLIQNGLELLELIAYDVQKCNKMVQYSKTFDKTLYKVKETISSNCTI